MGGRGSSSGLIGSGTGGRFSTMQNASPQPLIQQPQPQPQQPPVAPLAVDTTGFSATDDADFHDLYNGRQYYQQQQFSIDTEMALQDYLSDKATPGSMYSPSQQLNHAMKMGIALTANQQFMRDAMMDGMHNIGYNVNLTRYARVDFMSNLSKIAGQNLSNYSGMSETQIQKLLVGKSFTEDGFISTSYNDFRTAPNGGAPFTDKAVKINYKAPAATQALMPGNGPGGALGEMVLAPNQRYTITGVHFVTDSNGRRVQGRSGAFYYDRIEFDVTIG